MRQVPRIQAETAINKTTLGSNHPVHPLHADRLQRGAPSPSDVVVIFGPDQDEYLFAETQKQCEDGNLAARFIGDARHPIYPSDLKRKLSGHLGPKTHVFVVAHGSPGPQGHTLHCGYGEQLLTKELIRLLREPMDDTPAWAGPLHLLSCGEGALLGEIDPDSDLWKAGPVLLYGGNSDRPTGIPGEDVPAGIRFIAQCKQQGSSVTGMDAFVQLANWTSECTSIVGGDLTQPLTVHAPKSIDDTMPDALQAELRKRRAQQDLDSKIDSRVAGNPKDLESFSANVAKHAQRPAGNQHRIAAMLHIQADRGKPETVAKILKAHPKLLEDKSGTGDRTPLLRACIGRNRPVIEALLQLGANPNALTDDNRSPLSLAFGADDLEMIRLLCRYGADPYGKFGGRPVYEMARMNNRTEMMRVMDEESSKYAASPGKPTSGQARL